MASNKKELADAGRRKLDEWRANQAKRKSSSQSSATAPQATADNSSIRPPDPPLPQKPDQPSSRDPSGDAAAPRDQGEPGSSGTTASELQDRASAPPGAVDTSTGIPASEGAEAKSSREYVPRPPPPRPKFQKPPVFQRPPPFQPREIEPQPKPNPWRPAAPSDGVPELSESTDPEPASQVPDTEASKPSGEGTHTVVDKEPINQIGKDSTTASVSAYADLSDSYLSSAKAEDSPESQASAKSGETSNGLPSPPADGAGGSGASFPAIDSLTLPEATGQAFPQLSIRLPSQSKPDDSAKLPPKPSTWSFPWTRGTEAPKPPRPTAYPTAEPQIPRSSSQPPSSTSEALQPIEESPGKDAGATDNGPRKSSPPRSRHHRVASLNTWGVLPDEDESSSVTQPSRVEEPVGETSAMNSFNFEKLPEIDSMSHSAWPLMSHTSPHKSPVPKQNVIEEAAKAVTSHPGKMTRDPSFAHLMLENKDAEPDQFRGLQDHIDELTQEKFELKRGLEQQHGISAALAEENQRLLDDYNQQAVKMQQLEKEKSSRQTELSAQQLALDSLGGERDAGRSTLQEALQRADNLAAEVVSLEEKAYKARVAEVRASKRAEECQADADEAIKAKKASASQCIELKTIIADLQEDKMMLQEELRLRPPQDPTQSSSDPQGAQDAEMPKDNPLDDALAQLSSKEQGASRVIAAASQHAASLEPPNDAADKALPEHLQRLLPRRNYHGGVSGEAAEGAEEQKRVVSNIFDMVQKLKEEKQALLLFLESQQEQCRQLKAENARLKQQVESGQQGSNSGSPNPGKGSTFGWLTGGGASRTP